MSTCASLLTSYRISSYTSIESDIGLGGFILGFVYFMNTIVTISLVYRQKYLALQNSNEQSVKYVIFPIYIPFMWVSALMDMFVGVSFLFIHTEVYESNSWRTSMFISLVIALQHFVLEGIPFLMMQYGCGFRALKKAAYYAVCWSIITYFVEIYSFHDGHNVYAILVLEIWGILLLLFYLSLILVPIQRLYRRPAIISYAKFWLLFRILILVSDSLMWYSYSQNGNELATNISDCTYGFISLIIFAVCKPYIVYKTLLDDSKWWQGIMNIHNDSKKRKALIVNGRHSDIYKKIDTNSIYEGTLQNPLVGMEVGFSEAQILAAEVDNLIESNVRILNFAYIYLNQQELLGSGSFSRVYYGHYKKVEVAIKLLVTPDLNIDIIKRVCNEASILNNFSKNRNVVKIYGVSVLPPSVCIILELCKYGSLSDVLRGTYSDTNNNQVRAPLMLSLSDRMHLALGCAKGLQALHSYSKFLCHRDIKSFNFLVDAELNAKIADLELGKSDDVYNSDNYDDNSTKNCIDISGDDDRNYMDFQHDASVGMTISWQAPEVLDGHEYMQYADIYSLSLVLWEIIATIPQEDDVFEHEHSRNNHSNYNANKEDGRWQTIPFYEYSHNQLEIHRLIKSGVRPSMPNLIMKSYYSGSGSGSVSGSGSDSSTISKEYIQLIKQGWSESFHVRPTATEIVNTLYKCWVNTFHSTINDIAEIISNSDCITTDDEIGCSSIFKSNKLDANVVSFMDSLELKLKPYPNLSCFLIITAVDPFYILWSCGNWKEQSFHKIVVSKYQSNDSFLDYCPREHLLPYLNHCINGKPNHLVSHIQKKKNSYHSTSDADDTYVNHTVSLHIFPILENIAAVINQTSESTQWPQKDISMSLSTCSSSCSTVVNHFKDGVGWSRYEDDMRSTNNTTEAYTNSKNNDSGADRNSTRSRRSTLLNTDNSHGNRTASYILIEFSLLSL